MATVHITLNGEARTTSSSSLHLLLDEVRLLDKRVAVELNQEVVSRARYSETHLKNGDVIEIVQFVGGG